MALFLVCFYWEHTISKGCSSGNPMSSDIWHGEISHLLLQEPKGFRMSFNSLTLISPLGSCLLHRGDEFGGRGGAISHQQPFLLPRPVPSQTAGALTTSLRSACPLSKDGDLPRFGTNPGTVSPYPRSVSSPRMVDPSIKHWASVVKGSFFWKENKQTNKKMWSGKQLG